MAGPSNTLFLLGVEWPKRTWCGATHAEVRRGLRALNSVFGNKVAILAGDFLLARASVSLAALRNSEVIQLLSQVIEDLVTGEILQVSGEHLRTSMLASTEPPASQYRFWVLLAHALPHAHSSRCSCARTHMIVVQPVCVQLSCRSG